MIIISTSLSQVNLRLSFMQRLGYLSGTVKWSIVALQNNNIRFLLYEIQLYREWQQDEKDDIPTLPSDDTIFIDTCVISFLNQSAFSIFAWFLMVRTRGALSRLLFLTRAKNFKKLLIPTVIVVNWKKNTEMPSRFVDVTDRELTQFLEKILKVYE